MQKKGKIPAEKIIREIKGHVESNKLKIMTWKIK
jgi:hypothetical protein